MKTASVIVAVAAILSATPALAVNCTATELMKVMAAQTNEAITTSCASLAVDPSKPVSLTNLDFCKSDACQEAIKEVVATLPDCSMNGISISAGTAALLGKCKNPSPPPVPTREDGSPVPVPTGADGKPLPPPSGPPPPDGPGTVSPPGNNSTKKEETPGVTPTTKPTTKANTTVSGSKETANATTVPPKESTEDDAGYEDTKGSSSQGNEETTINVPGGGPGSAESANETPKPSATTAASLSPRLSSSMLASAMSAVTVVLLSVAVCV